MKTTAMIAAALIATTGFAGSAMAQQTKHVMTGQEKAVRYQHDRQEKMWDQQRKQGVRSADSATYGAPNRQSYGRSQAQQPEDAAPSSFGIPGSGAAFYNYNKGSKNWYFGY